MTHAGATDAASAAVDAAAITLRLMMIACGRNKLGTWTCAKGEIGASRVLWSDIILLYS